MSVDPDAIWNALPTPVLLLDDNDRILRMNPAAEAFVLSSSRAAAGQPVWDRLAVDAPLDAAVARARAHDAAVFVNDVDVSAGHGPPVQCNLHIAPLTGAPGQMILHIAPRELAGRMRQGDGLSRAARSAIGMAEMLAHEIKNPLAGITGAAQLLSMTLGPQDRELTDLIVSETRRIVELLEQVEQFGNVATPRLGPVNLHDVLDRARRLATVGVAAHMAIVQDYDPSLPPALGNTDHLLQVMLNLLNNAAQAAPEGGTIRLRSYYDPSLRLRREGAPDRGLPLHVEVIDDGPGFPAAIEPDAFEPFVSGRENGTGLGLALAAKIMADHGGRIAIDSAPGRTVVRLSLQRAVGQEQEAE